MKKIFKITAIVIFVLIVAMIVTPFVFKKQIVQKVKDEINNNINAKVDFTDFGLSLFRSFPDFSLKLEQLTIVGVDEFKGDTLAHIPALYVTIDLMSVIKGSTYQVKTIRLNKPSILLKVLKNGKPNWDIAKSSPAEESTTTTTTSSPFKIQLKKVQIQKGKLIYDDASINTYVAAIGIDHTLRGDFTADFTSLKTKSFIDAFSLSYGGIKYFNKVNVAMKTDIDADLNKFKFTFKNNDTRINDLFLVVDGYFAMLDNGYDMDMKFEAKKNSFKNFLSLIPAVYAKDFSSVKTEGSLALSGYVKGIYNDKSMPAFALNIQVDNAMFKYPDLPKAVTNISINTKIVNTGGTMDNTTVDISKLHFEMGTAPVDIKLLIKTPLSDPQLSGSFSGALDLAQVKEFYPLEKEELLDGRVKMNVAFNGRMSAIEKQQYASFNATGMVLLENMNYKSKDFPQQIMIRKAQLNFTPAYLELASFDVKIGKSDVNAHGKITNYLGYVFKNESIRGDFAVNSTLLNLNEFMSSTPTTESSSEDAENGLSVIKVPNRIDFVLTSKIGHLLYDNMTMTNIIGVLKVQDEKIVLDKLQMNTLDGQLTVSGSYSTKNTNNPLVDFHFNINQFDIQKSYKTFGTMKKLVPIAEKTTGKFSAGMSLTTTLDSKMMPIYETMNGKGNLSTSTIVVKDVSTLNKIADALKMDKLRTLKLDKIDLSFEFKNGKVYVDPFDIKAGETKATISGTTAFDQTIDYVMKFQIPRSSFGGAANGVLNNLVAQANSKGANVKLSEVINVDVLIGGTVTNPIVKTGLKGSIDKTSDNIKDQVNEEVDKKKEELEKKAKEEADRLKKEAEDRLKSEQQKAKAEVDRLKKEAEQKAKSEADRIKKEAESKAKAEADRLKKEAEEKARKEAEKQAKEKLKKLFP